MCKLLVELGLAQRPGGEHNVWQQWAMKEETRGTLGSSRQEYLEAESGSSPSANAGQRAVKRGCDGEYWKWRASHEK